MGIKMIYKKTLAFDLIKAGHMLEYTTRNRKNKKFQCYAFNDSPELRKSIARINNQSYKG
ncbi:hypothetical protein ACQKD6_02660 [Bacillus cereus]|uniref:hypothetical protein n=1 Tax=Bacillus cereus TaxID=1396 RepID=UPI003CFD8F54